MQQLWWNDDTSAQIVNVNRPNVMDSQRKYQNSIEREAWLKDSRPLILSSDNEANTGATVSYNTAHSSHTLQTPVHSVHQSDSIGSSKKNPGQSDSNSAQPKPYAGLGRRHRQGSSHLTTKALPFESEDYLDQFCQDVPNDHDPWKRYVVRFRYVGTDTKKDMRAYLTKVFLINTLNFPKEDVVAVIRLPGSKETDICLASERAYKNFWTSTRAACINDSSLLEGFEIIPLFRGGTKVLTVSFRTTTIPEQDVALWVSKYANILMGPVKKRDNYGVWTGEYHCVVTFKNQLVDSWGGDIPKYFFLGSERGTINYIGQPAACFECGAYDHKRRACTTPLCANCGGHGHPTAACHYRIKCNLCDEEGHTYFCCPKAHYNKLDAEHWYKATCITESGKQTGTSREAGEGMWRQRK
ncbi:MOB kinase activator 1B isoform X2 [Rhineura floridana]|uniref:MOB kinase activator 1B isoform X2 n=1 Tax=Rhineura floridana TaxID=261503 RepID=UPI002AC83BBB|nr:MOB kinase activator 1B isoform X2 [Rhineura floridana]